MYTSHLTGAQLRKLLLGMRSCLLACIVTIFGMIPLGGAERVLAADQPLGISKKVLPPLKAAGDAINAKQFDVALAKLLEAEAVDKKTPYDQFQIEETRALMYLSQNTNYPEALAIFEKHLSTPEYLAPQAAAVRLKLMIQLAFRTQEHDKTIKYAQEWLATNPEDTGVMDTMMRSYYIKKDYKNAIETAKSAAAIAEKAGKTPDELWLQIVPSSASSLDDKEGVFAGYQKLLRYYPKNEHWTKVLEVELASEKSDLAIFYALRLMADTGVLTRGDNYYEYAQRALENALPGEALKVLETGLEKKVIGETDKARYQRTVAEVKQKVQVDRAQLPDIEKELKNSKSTSGQAGAGLGLAYFGYQMYEQAIPTLEAAIAKGGLRNLDDYRMTLGIAYLRTGQKEKARELFQAVPANSPLVKVAGLWAARSYN